MPFVPAQAGAGFIQFYTIIPDKVLSQLTCRAWHAKSDPFFNVASGQGHNRTSAVLYLCWDAPTKTCLVYSHCSPSHRLPQHVHPRYSTGSYAEAGETKKAPLSFPGKASEVTPVTQKGSEKHHWTCSEQREQQHLLPPAQHSSTRGCTHSSTGVGRGPAALPGSSTGADLVLPH